MFKIAVPVRGSAFILYRLRDPHVAGYYEACSRDGSSAMPQQLGATPANFASASTRWGSVCGQQLLSGYASELLPQPMFT